MGKEKASTYKVYLPDGKEHVLHNGDRGFFLRQVHAMRSDEGITSLRKSIKLTDALEIGKRNIGSWPASAEVSKHHLDVACINNYYFIKDAKSKKGTYIKIGSKKNNRIELHKGMTFAVGRLHYRVLNIQGDCADNRKIKEKMDREREERKANEDAKGKPEVELDDDEEFADDSDDEDGGGGGGGGKGKFDGPPVMFLNPLDKKLPHVKGRIRETSTIGSDKDKNKIVIKEETAKERKIDAIHTRIVLEDGHFYLENVSKGFGTYVGIPTKGKYFQINGGDHLLLAGARTQIEVLPAKFTFLDGLIDKIIGKSPAKFYDMKVLSLGASIEERLAAACMTNSQSKSRDDDSA